MGHRSAVSASIRGGGSGIREIYSQGHGERIGACECNGRPGLVGGPQVADVSAVAGGIACAKGFRCSQTSAVVGGKIRKAGTAVEHVPEIPPARGEGSPGPGFLSAKPGVLGALRADAQGMNSPGDTFNAVPGGLEQDHIVGLQIQRSATGLKILQISQIHPQDEVRWIQILGLGLSGG